MPEARWTDCCPRARCAKLVSSQDGFVFTGLTFDSENVFVHSETHFVTGTSQSTMKNKTQDDYGDCQQEDSMDMYVEYGL